ncbi:MAG: BREX-1 system adenine-specific DNA-methyltransferase PglX, partial [Cyanobacteriota bacterium]
MPVNTASLKAFAPAMRRQLMEAVGRKLDLLLHSQTPDTLSTYARQISELREQEAENREQLLERVAYTWFNRLCALRYLDARGWHPFGCKVLMPAAEGETQPELLKLMRAGSLPAELKPHTNEARLHGLLDGQIPPAMAGADPQGEVYRELVLASCRSYHQLLPELFEVLDDASELLLPDDLLSEGSIAGGFRSAISDADCEDVEIIGWLYQFYISEKKDQVIGKVVKSEDIPAATQLFTPNWIVKYMVQNSIGATWLATYPDSPLKGQMEFYIEPAEQTPEVQTQLVAITPESLDPEALTLIDPACGSGHILVEAYNLLKAIYLERGYRQRDIPELILTKNLYGLDICPRATQLAAFSLLMKGREDDRRLLERGIQLNVMALQNSTGLNVERLAESVDLSAAGASRADVRMLAELFAHATTFGSLIQIPALLTERLPALSRAVEKKSQDLFTSADLQKLGVLLRQGGILARRYDAVVANPPYIGSKFHTPDIKKFLKDNYLGYEKDAFSAFMIRNLSLVRPFGRLGFMTPQGWMFLSAHEKLRSLLLSQHTIESLVQPEFNAFWASAHVTICGFTIRNQHITNYRGTYIRLTDFYGADIQPIKTLEAIKNPHCGWLFIAQSDEFKKIPGSPVAYWISEKVRNAFGVYPTLGDLASSSNGVQTGDNARFVRLWAEVDQCKIYKKWIPYNKGGNFRKWYGNIEHLVLWENNGQEIKGQPNSCYRGEEHYTLQGITWSYITSARLSARYLPEGCIFDAAGPSAFANDENTLFAILGLLNTEEVNRWSKILNPSVNFQSGDFRKLILAPGIISPETTFAVKSLISNARADWDAYERSWNFQCSPLLPISHKSAQSLKESYVSWVTRNKIIIDDTKRIEEKNYRLFVSAYDLAGDIVSDVPVEQITLTINPTYRYGDNIADSELWNRFCQDTIKEFLSYATGCMMGRYSLDQPGLILADSRSGQSEQLTAYEAKVGKPLSEVQFKPDPDGIIPVLDGEWFEDDIVARTREFLAVTFPESSV